MYPDIITKTIEYFKKFNGIGEKTAERLSLSVLDMSQEDVENFSLSIKELKNKIVKCKVCGHITDEDICNICNNKFRNDNLINDILQKLQRSSSSFHREGTERSQQSIT